MSDQPVGCLGILLRLFELLIGGVGESSSLVDRLPYRQRDDFLSPAELSFFKVLQQAVRDSYVLCPKVSLNDLFFVIRWRKNLGARNKISQKHVDFVVCDLQTMAPLCAIELDDRSHSRQDRIDRDEFVNEVFEVAELPLIRITAARSYVVSNLQAQIHAAVERRRRQKPPHPLSTKTKPLCPKCGEKLTRRVARRGANKGNEFWGCPNFPKCRHVEDIR